MSLSQTEQSKRKDSRRSPRKTGQKSGKQSSSLKLSLERISSIDRNLLIQSFLENPPRDDDELHLFIHAVTGFRIPRLEMCHAHQAPFALIADLYFQRVTHSIGFANRGGGKTLAMAILDLCEQVLKPGIETIHFGAIQAQADACYRYFRQFIMSSPVLQDLVLAAIREAMRLADEAVGEKLGGLTGGMKIPGLNM